MFAGTYHRQPFKSIYLLWQLATIPVFRLPSWLLSGFLISLEERKGTWNLTRHLRCCLFRHVIHVSHHLGIRGVDHHNHLALGEEKNSNGVWIPSLSSDLILGEIKTRADALEITSISIPGYWIHKSDDISLEAPPSPGEKVVYHVHGGGYTMQTAHPDSPLSNIPKGYLEYCQSLRRTFAVEYRLSAGPPFEPANPFPTALIDVLAGYLYLVNMGFAEKDIIVSGNSAGGNAVLALTRYLVQNRDTQPRLPSPPGSIILVSPWVDASECFERSFGPQSSQVRFANHDWLAPSNTEVAVYSAKAFLGGDVKEAYSNPYISPANRQLLGVTGSHRRIISFQGFPRTFIDMGGFEVLLDQVHRLRDAMVEDMGEEMVRYNEVDGEVHDYLPSSAHEPDRSNTLKKIASWIESH